MFQSSLAVLYFLRVADMNPLASKCRRWQNSSHFLCCSTDELASGEGILCIAIELGHIHEPLAVLAGGNAA